jgi:hypothetical protein
MIRKLLFILFSFGILTHSVYGQDSSTYKSKLQTRLLVGTNIPVTKLLQGAETDYLFEYDDHSYYWQILSLTYFFHRHWGVEFNFQAGTSSRIRKRIDNFIANIQSEYGANYYVNPRINSNEFNFFGGSMQRSYFGIIYRFETDKFYAYPKFLFGVTSSYKNRVNIDLKKRNFNNEYSLSYSDGKVPNDEHFSLAPSVSFGYKIFKRFYLNADIMFSYFRTNVVFEKEFTDLYTKKSTMKHFDYKKDILTLSLGAGLIFVIR